MVATKSREPAWKSKKARKKVGRWLYQHIGREFVSYFRIVRVIVFDALLFMAWFYFAIHIHHVAAKAHAAGMDEQAIYVAKAASQWSIFALIMLKVIRDLLMAARPIIVTVLTYRRTIRNMK